MRALFDLQDYEEALNTCNKLFELKPVSPVIVHIKGVLLMLLGQWEEAIKLINESILLDKTFIAWQEIKGICLSHIISESQEAINRM